MVLTRIVAAALVAVALAGCSQQPESVTDETLISELQQAGVEPANGIASWRVAMNKGTCESSEQALKLALRMPEMTREVMQSMRVAAVHFCPDRVAPIDAALKTR